MSCAVERVDELVNKALVVGQQCALHLPLGGAAEGVDGGASQTFEAGQDPHAP